MWYWPFLCLTLLFTTAQAWKQGNSTFFATPLKHQRGSEQMLQFIVARPFSVFSVAYNFSRHVGGVLVLCPAKYADSIFKSDHVCSPGLVRQWECACAKDISVSKGHWVTYTCSLEPTSPIKYGLFSIPCKNPTPEIEAINAGWEGNWTLFDGANPLDAPRRSMPIAYITCFAISVIAMLVACVLSCVLHFKEPAMLDHKKKITHFRAALYFSGILFFSGAGLEYSMSLKNAGFFAAARFASNFQSFTMGLLISTHIGVVSALVGGRYYYVPGIIGITLGPFFAITFGLYDRYAARDLMAIVFYAVLSVALVTTWAWGRYKPDPDAFVEFEFSRRWNLFMKGFSYVLGLLLWLTLVPVFHILPILKPESFYANDTWAFRHPSWVHVCFAVVYVILPLIYYIFYASVPREYNVPLAENEELNQTEESINDKMRDKYSSGDSEDVSLSSDSGTGSNTSRDDGSSSSSI